MAQGVHVALGDLLQTGLDRRCVVPPFLHKPGQLNSTDLEMHGLTFHTSQLPTASY